MAGEVSSLGGIKAPDGGCDFPGIPRRTFCGAKLFADDSGGRECFWGAHCSTTELSLSVCAAGTWCSPPKLAQSVGGCGTPTLDRSRRSPSYSGRCRTNSEVAGSDVGGSSAGSGP